LSGVPSPTSRQHWGARHDHGERDQAGSACRCAAAPRRSVLRHHAVDRPDRLRAGGGELQADVGTTFAEANRVARSVEVDRFVRSGTIALSERRFPPAVPPEVTARWRAALGDLACYGNLLATLTGTGRGGVQTDAFRQLGVQLTSGTTAADLDPGVTTGLAALAGALVDLRAQSTARDILHRTDPDVRRLLVAMADAVGSSEATLLTTFNGQRSWSTLLLNEHGVIAGASYLDQRRHG
jgi:hypothetical protein